MYKCSHHKVRNIYTWCIIFIIIWFLVQVLQIVLSYCFLDCRQLILNVAIIIGLRSLFILKVIQLRIFYVLPINFMILLWGIIVTNVIVAVSFWWGFNCLIL